MSSKPTEPFNIKRLLSEDNYTIPIYQRDYAWTESQIKQLIQDVADTAAVSSKGTNYYIGTLIAFERIENGVSVFETIDGQQRLTTLSIILFYLKNNQKIFNIDLSWFTEVKLSFDSRKKSTDSLTALFYNDIKMFDNLNTNIIDGYEIVEKYLKNICKEKGITVETFANYLFTNVVILRVLVPKDTDLNHYFEIMNSRGEQLEKHEILKAKCLSILEGLTNEQYAFNKVWEACSNMERYIQYGFDPQDERKTIFGNNWDTFQIRDYKDFYYKIKFKKPIVDDSKKEKEIDDDSESKPIFLSTIIKENPDTNIIIKKVPDSETTRFNTVINFSNFLLHILKIQRSDDKEITLDDKKLLTHFDTVLDSMKDKNEKIQFVLIFGYNLLKGKFLFDKYILKREYLKGKDNWSLKRLYTNIEGKDNNSIYSGTFSDGENDTKDNREILLLLSMFHVSTPTLVYKYWLTACLFWLFNNENPRSNDYKQFLKNLALSFLERFIGNPKPEYDDIVFKKVMKPFGYNLEFEKLDTGVEVENFIFNFLDYLLWLDYQKNKKFTGKINDQRIIDFEYTFRSSVEHYYPQSPMDGESLDKRLLNSFGNLCLISSSKNSRLSNYMPIAKKDHYNNSPTIDSIKQRVMMESPQWTAKEILEQEQLMKDCIKSAEFILSL